MSRKNPDNPGVFVLGSTNIDLICRTEALPLPGETVLGGDVLQAFGGKGANQAVAAARAGARDDVERVPGVALPCSRARRGVLGYQSPGAPVL